MPPETSALMRRWARRPVIPFAVTLSLALGTAIVASAFAVADLVLFRPLPFHDARTLAFAWGSTDITVRRGLTEAAVDMLLTSTSFESAALFLPPSPVQLNDDVDPVQEVSVDTRFTLTLGVSPILGRSFQRTDALADDGILISSRLWRTRFGGDPAVIGRSVTIDGTRTAVIVGVMPRGFFFPEHGIDIWRPVDTHATFRTAGDAAYLGVVRLRDRTTLAQAQEEVDVALSGRGRPSVSSTVGLFEVRRAIMGDAALAAVLLLTITGLLLVLVLANVTALLAVTYDEQRVDFAIRATLGASWGQLYRTIAIEHLALVGMGISLGLLAARAAVASIQEGTGLRMLEDASLDIRAAVILGLITSTAALLIAAIFGRRSVLSFAPSSATVALRAGIAAPRRATVRILALLQLAVTPALLATAVLCAGDVARLMMLDWGFDGRRSLLFELAFPVTMARQLEAQDALIRQVRSTLLGLPQVGAVGMGYTAPIRQGRATRGVRIEVDGREVLFQRSITQHTVGPGFFDALGVVDIRGRAFDERDERGARRVVVVNDVVARALFSGADPIGRIVHMPRGSLEPAPQDEQAGDAVEVIGVVPHIRMYPLDWPRPIVYVDYRQQVSERVGMIRPRFLLRVRGTLEDSADSAPAHIASLLEARVPGVQVLSASPLLDLLDQSLREFGTQEVLAALALAVAGVGLLLTGAGVYGLFAELVLRKRHEIGIRLSLGADRRGILSLVLGEVLSLVLLGVAAAVPGCLLARYLLKDVLISIQPDNVIAWATAAGLIVLGTVTASALPLMKALSINPSELLRDPAH